MTTTKPHINAKKKKDAYDFSVENEMKAEVIALIQKYRERGIDIRDIKVDQFMSSHLTFKFNSNHPSIQRLMADLNGQGSQNIARGMNFDTIEYSDWKYERQKDIDALKKALKNSPFTVESKKIKKTKK